MKHFMIEQWADFARGVVEGKDKAMMQRHLDEGCKACQKEVSLWQRVKEAASRQPNSAPSEGAVRSAKAMFAAQRPLAESAVAEILFDSMQAPALAGVRSAAGGARQMLFGLGNHRIDLRVELQSESHKGTIIGQILDSSDPGVVAGNVPISLYLDHELVTVSETNEFGEFQLECSLAGRLQLRATLPQGQEISVILLEPASPELSQRLRLVDSLHKSQADQPKNRTRKKA